MNYLILQYSYLQILDFLTTIAFLVNGVKEANPIVVFSMRLTQSPLGSLLFIKLAAVALGLYCWRVGKHQLLARFNIVFAALVAWNIIALIMGSAVITG